MSLSVLAFQNNTRRKGRNGKVPEIRMSATYDLSGDNGAVIEVFKVLKEDNPLTSGLFFIRSSLEEITKTV